jgi:hypothetical protein
VRLTVSQLWGGSASPEVNRNNAGRSDGGGGTSDPPPTPSKNQSEQLWEWTNKTKHSPGTSRHTVKNAVELFFAFHPDVEKIQYH